MQFTIKIYFIIQTKNQPAIKRTGLYFLKSADAFGCKRNRRVLGYGFLIGYVVLLWSFHWIRTRLWDGLDWFFRIWTGSLRIWILTLSVFSNRQGTFCNHGPERKNRQD